MTKKIRKNMLQCLGFMVALGLAGCGPGDVPTPPAQPATGTVPVVTPPRVEVDPCISTTRPGPTLPAGGGDYTPAASEALHTSLVTTVTAKPSVAGALRTARVNCQVTLTDERGTPIQLRGMSTHGLQWFPEIINDNAFSAMSEDWGANVVRLAMYVGEGGYASKPDLINKVMQGIDLAIANDLYVIVDWHVHAPGDPNAPEYKGALEFFRTISAKYPNNRHIIYELANEPNHGNAPGVSNDAAGWASVKAYATPIIAMLRQAGNRNLVIVGTPSWSQRPDLAAANPIVDDNVMYTVHFYSGSHSASNSSTERGNVMSNARYALEHGIGIFSTEWGVSQASGDKGPYLKEADQWLDFLNKHNISWVNWALTNKNETSGAFIPYVAGASTATNLDPGIDQLWSIRELSISGEYVRNRIKGMAFKPLNRSGFATIVSNFDDGTLGGWGINSGSPVTTVALSNDAGALKLSGMTASSDVTTGGFWNNVRLSADGLALHPYLFGANNMTADITVAAPATVAIAALPQNGPYGWANPTGAVIINPASFVLQASGKYKATLTITLADSPNFKSIAEDPDTLGGTMTNLILFVGARGVEAVTIDNIAFDGNRATSGPAVVHAPLGSMAAVSTFEDSTRQGWAFDAASGVQGSLTVVTANGSKALSWDVTYPDVKPGDAWASAPRLALDVGTTARGTNQFLTYDFYLKPQRATRGAITLNLSFGAPTLGYWAQPTQIVTINLSDLATMTKTADGLYRFQGRFDLNVVSDSKVITPTTALGKIFIVAVDANSDFTGKMYIDNIQFAP